MKDTNYRRWKARKEISLYNEFKHSTYEQMIAVLQENDSLKVNAAIQQLQLTGTDKAFILAKDMCFSKDKSQRRKGVAILSQFNCSLERGNEIFNLFERVLKDETSALVKAEVINAMGHQCKKNEQPKERLIAHCARLINDKSSSVRCAIAFSLSFVQDRKAIPLLEHLLNDANGDVKNWSAFAVNVNDWDSESIRRAFINMLSDENEEARTEALLGLAERKDKRVSATLGQQLTTDIVFDDLIIAAGDLGDKTLLPVLKSMLDNFDDNELIKKAIKKLEFINPHV